MAAPLPITGSQMINHIIAKKKWTDEVQLHGNGANWTVRHHAAAGRRWETKTCLFFSATVLADCPLSRSRISLSRLPRLSLLSPSLLQQAPH